MNSGRAHGAAKEELFRISHMPMSYDILDGLVSHSVKVGELLVPASSLESHLGRFVLNLVVWNHHETFKVSLVGSAIPIFYRENYFLVCSRHQLKGVDLENVSILYPDGSAAITSSGSRMFNLSDETTISDAYDIAAFNFSEPISQHPYLKGLFYHLQALPPDTMNDNIVAFVLSGFPCADQRYELEEKNHLGLVKRIFVALPDCQPRDRALLRLKHLNELNFDADGLSGGPAFVVQKVENKFHAFLAGMMVRGGKDFSYILKVGFIAAFLDSAVETL